MCTRRFQPLPITNGRRIWVRAPRRMEGGMTEHDGGTSPAGPVAVGGD
jgi:hypothetical protein